MNAAASVQPETPARPDWLAVGAILALLAAVLVPFVVPMMPQLYLQFDPRQMRQAAVTTELGPTGIAWWQAYALLASGVALLVAWRRGVRASWGVIGLAGLAMLTCGSHIVRGSMNDRLTAGAWLAAMALGLAAAHLGQLRDARRWAAAALVAVLLPVALDAAYYVLVSHPQTVQSYLDNQAELLEARGWLPGSAEAIKYEQRLRASDATGAFGLSNVLGSFAATLSLLAIFLACSALLRRRALAAVCAILALLGLATLGWTQSKGAMAAFVAGGCLLVVTAWVMRRAGRGERGPRGRGLVAGLAVALLVVAVAAVIGRGVMGPPTDASGERSILFRYHYLQGAAAMWVGQWPQTLTFGTGPDRFGFLYPRYKNPISPESVTSAHNVAADYGVMLGVGGLAAVALLLLWLWRGACGVPDAASDEAPAGRGIDRPHLIAAGLLGGAVFGIAYLVEVSGMGPDQAVMWLVGLVGFVGLTAWLARPGALPSAAMQAAAFVAAACLLIHAQIEMTFFNLASAGPAWFIVGLCGARHHAGATMPGKRALPGALPGAGLCAIAVLFAASNASLITRQQAHVARAASALSVNNWQVALEELDRSAAYIAADDKPLRYRVALRLEMAGELGRNGMRTLAQERLDAALAIVEEAERRGLSPLTAHRYRAQAYRIAAEQLGVSAAWPIAAAAMQAASEASPYNVFLCLDAADFAALAGRQEQALALYRRALELDARNYLDEAHQLSVEERRRIERIIAQAG